MPVPRRLASLLRAAAKVRSRAYAPYSRFPVGAAVLAGGRIHAACNVENSSYPLGVCAERNAVAMAVAAGAKRIEAVAIVGGNGRPAAPCGGCRQVLAEFCDEDVPVVYANPAGKSILSTIGALLPQAFRPGDVMEAAGSTGSRRAPPGTSRSAARGRGTRSSGR